MNPVTTSKRNIQPVARTAALPYSTSEGASWGTMLYRLLVGLAVLAASTLAAHATPTHAANTQQPADDPYLQPGNVIIPVNSGITPSRGASVGGDNADQSRLPSTDSLLFSARQQNYTSPITSGTSSTPLSARQQNYTSPIPEGEISQYNGGYMTPPAQGAPVFPGYGPDIVPQPSWAVSPGDFQNLLNAINNQTFASNQLPMVQAAGLCGWFTCSQCAAIMNCFSFDSNRLQVVRYLAPHIIDPIRCQPIMDQLSFSDDRQTAWRLLSQARL